MTKIKSTVLSKLFLLMLITFSILSCQKKNQSSNPNEKLRVISSFSILSEMVKEIGKDSVIVHNLVPVGVDPHEHQMTPEDIKFASFADLFIYNGLNLEGGDTGWFTKMVQSLSVDPDRVFQITNGIEPQYLSENAGRKEVNPHAFIDPNNGIIMAQNIRDILIKADPNHKVYYQKNATRYIKDLKAVEEEYQRRFSKIPKENRVFIASEEAFQYLIERYDFKEGYIWAIDTEENGSPEQIKNAIHFVKKNQPKVLFIESNVDRRPMETVAKSTGVPIYDPPIFSDELGKPGHEADSYIKYLKYNLKHIYQGLTAGK